MFDQLDLAPLSRVLELGAGSGALWKENLDRVPEGWQITLTDLSPGMLEEAAERLGSRFEYRVADAQNLPFDDRSFDAVIANHMLYHVPDVPRAISEARRVLRQGGVLYAATNGRSHMRELDGLIGRFLPGRASPGTEDAHKNFSLETGGELLHAQFPEVTLRRYEDALVVTDAEPLAAYILSWAGAEGVSADELTVAIEREIAAHGPIRITKDSGLFIARG